MPRLGLTSSPAKATGASDVKQVPEVAPTASTVDVTEEAPATAEEDPATSPKDKALEDAARLYTKEGHQTDEFKAAVCQCISLGIAQIDIARKIRVTAYAEPVSGDERDDRAFKRIYDKVNRINNNVWKRSQFYTGSNKTKKAPKAVEALLATMENLTIGDDKENNVTVNAQAAPLALFEKVLNSSIGKTGQDTAPAAGIEGKVLEMKQLVLDISHQQAGCFLLSGKPASPEAASAKRRVNYLIEHPAQVDEYIRLGLRSQPNMTSLQMIQMLDYYREL